VTYMRHHSRNWCLRFRSMQARTNAVMHSSVYGGSAASHVANITSVHEHDKLAIFTNRCLKHALALSIHI
jgi:hypothetical protein